MNRAKGSYIQKRINFNSHSRLTKSDYQNPGLSEIYSDAHSIMSPRYIEEELRKKEEKFRLFFEYAPDYCYMISPQNKILDVNRTSLKALGYKKEELIGKSLKTIYAPESFPKVKKLFAKWKKTGRLKDEELIILTKKGERRTVILSAKAMRGRDGKIISSISIQKDITEHKRVEDELEQSQKRLRGLSVHLQDLREDERKRIAHAIHEDLGQLLTVLNIDLTRFLEKIPSNLQPLKEMARSIRDLVDESIETVQRISTELRPKLLDDLGLIPAIEWQVHEFQNHTGIKCNININTNGISPDSDRSIVIFRILQEALTNVARHARATRVRVDLKANSRRLTLKIKDNGKGISPKQITEPDSFGIIVMQESVLPWEGKFDIQGIKDKGTTVKASLPLFRKDSPL